MGTTKQKSTTGTPSKQQIERFIKLRNKSDFSNNLQFEIDADACGFTAKDLGDVVKQGFDYMWVLPYGVLRESQGKLSLVEVG